jgi:hypothetical protein
MNNSCSRCFYSEDSKDLLNIDSSSFSKIDFFKGKDILQGISLNKKLVNVVGGAFLLVFADGNAFDVI